MASRRRARVMALQLLYQQDLTGAPRSRLLDDYWSALAEDDEGLLGGVPAGGQVGAEERAFAEQLVRGVWEERERLDQLIEAASLNWRLPRMPVVDRNILRLSTYELVHRRDIPVSVTINEAVELAKQFGGADSRAFVNGILDRIAQDIGRGGRGGRRGQA